jgi:hypothetical protein
VRKSFAKFFQEERYVSEPINGHGGHRHLDAELTTVRAG